MILEQLLFQSEHDSALRAVGPYRLIDYTVMGDSEYTVEAMPATLKEQGFVRLRVTRKSDRPRNDGSRSFVWPVADPEDPRELEAIARKLMDATLGIRPRRDPRGLRLRLLHQLTRRRLLNHIENLASVTVADLGKIRLSVSIFEDAPDEELVILYQHRSNNRVAIVELPMTSVERIREWARNARAFHFEPIA